MEVFADMQQLCPCYKEHQEFQKVLELNDSGLEIYLHRLSTDNIRQGEAIESSVNSNRDVFILHNKKDVKITTSRLTLELENKHMRCSLCRNILEHAQELMQELKSIDRKIIIGICDYCRKRALVSKKSFCVCDKIVKMFKSFKAVQTEDPKKSIKVWPSKTEHVLKDKSKEICAYSNLLINQDLISPAVENRPEVQQIFFSVTNFESDNKKISGTGLKTGYVKKASTQPIKRKKTTFDYTPHEIINTKKLGTSSVELDTSLEKTNVGVKELARPIKRLQLEKNFQDTPSRDAKEELKRRHDLSLRQMMKHKKDSGFSESKTPDVYGITKVAPWEQKESTPKYHVESEMNIKITSTRKPHDFDSRSSDYASKRQAKFESSEKSRNLHDSPEPPKYSQDKIKKGSHDLEKRAKDAMNLEDSYFATDVKLGRSASKVKKLEQRGMKSKSRSMEAQFSYVFPKPKEKKIKKISVKSSELIKNTRDKLKERQQKLEQEQKIKLSQEKKKPQAEEQTNVAEEQQKLVEKDKSRKVVLGKKRKSEVAKKVSISKPDQENEIEAKSKEKGYASKLVPFFSKSSSDDGIHEESRELLKNYWQPYGDFGIFIENLSIYSQKVTFDEVELMKKTRNGQRNFILT